MIFYYIEKLLIIKAQAISMVVAASDGGDGCGRMYVCSLSFLFVCVRSPFSVCSVSKRFPIVFSIFRKYNTLCALRLRNDTKVKHCKGSVALIAIVTIGKTCTIHERA